MSKYLFIFMLIISQILFAQEESFTHISDLSLDAIGYNNSIPAGTKFTLLGTTKSGYYKVTAPSVSDGELLISQRFFRKATADTLGKAWIDPKIPVGTKLFRSTETDSTVTVYSIDEKGNIFDGPYTLAKRYYELAILTAVTKGIRTERVNSKVTAPSTECAPGEQAARGRLTNPTLKGAYKVMATLYQSCEALDGRITRDTTLGSEGVTRVNGRGPRKLVDRGQYIQAHYVLRKLQSAKDKGQYPKANCRDILETPPIYAYGAYPETTGNTISMFNDLTKSGCPANGIQCSSQSVIGMDCADFINTAFRASGLRLYANEDDPDDISTMSLADQTWRSNSCLKNVPFDGVSEGLKPGDIINSYDNHVVMIDTIGPDPLALKKHQNCNDIIIGDFDFTFIQSGSIGNLGVARVEAAYHASNKSSFMKKLLSKAKSLCSQLKKSNNTTNNHRVRAAEHFAILRHRSEKEECHQPKKALEGESCVRKCLEGRI